MRTTIRNVLVLSSFILLAEMFLLIVFYHCYSATPGGRKIFVGQLPDNARPFIASPIILQKMFSDLINPEMPSVEDIGDTTDQDFFIAGGFGFILFDDFNNDGLLEVALVGKYDNKVLG